MAYGDGNKNITGSFDDYDKFVIHDPREGKNCIREVSSSEYQAIFGFLPTNPGRGDMIFGGAYGHTAGSTGSAGYTGDRNTHIYSAETELSHSNKL
tara:strand:+ start:194 stop:481 length:288 start_codon:yes stop_codon:yes gene_type:complete